jgi:hypothetical protein
MMPAQIMGRAIAMLANTGPQPLHLRDQPFAIPTIEVPVEVHADLL